MQRAESSVPREPLEGRAPGAMIPDLAEMVFFHATAEPDRPAVITGQAILSYGKLRRGILSVQQQLARHGLKAGDKVAIHIDHAVAHIALIAALYRAGIASVSLEVGQADFITDLVVDAVLTNVPNFKPFGRLIAVEDSWFEATDVDPAPPNAALDMPDDALCRLILSSGTTGRPKIIGLTYEAVRERLVSYAIRTSTPSWERLVCMLGLSTNFGYSSAITALWLGRTTCFSFDAPARNFFIYHQADLLVASTHQIASLVQYQEQNFMRLESLRSIHIGGAVAYAPLSIRIRTMICDMLYCGYGSTEGGTVAYVPAEAIFGMDRAVGITVPWVEVEVLDEQKQPRAHGEEGEIRIRALGQGYRYTKISDDAYEIAGDEWFYPGDRGVLYRNGVLVITGRINEMINRGGVKVAPETVEEEIKKHAAIADAAAVGVLDDLGIEQIWLAVVAKEAGELEIKRLYEYCHEHMPLFVPDRIFQVQEIPRNQTGKISRAPLTDQLRMLEASMAHAMR